MTMPTFVQVGKYVDWDRTMRRDTVTQALHKKLATGGDHGWNKDEKMSRKKSR